MVKRSSKGSGPAKLRSRLSPKKQDARNDKRVVRAERGIFDLFARKAASRTRDPKTGTIRGYIPDKPDHFRDP